VQFCKGILFLKVDAADLRQLWRVCTAARHLCYYSKTSKNCDKKNKGRPSRRSLAPLGGGGCALMSSRRRRCRRAKLESVFKAVASHSFCSAGLSLQKPLLPSAPLRHAA
jgi:hypothetical protein